MIEARGIHYFITVAETLHFGRAAEMLFISQSSVSEGISRLEATVGGQLFDRAGRRIRLTTLGEKLYQEVHQPAIALEKAIEEAKLFAMRRYQVLKVGFLGGGLYEATRGVVEDFHSHADGVVLEFVELDISHYFSSVLHGEVDVAIVRRPPEDDRLAVGPVIRRDPVVLVVPSDHRFVGRSCVSSEDLAGEKLVRFDTGMPVPPSWVTAGGPQLTPSGKLIGTAAMVRTIREALTVVAAGAGVSVFASKLFDYYRDPGIALIPLEGVSVESVLVWRKSDSRQSIQDFVESVARVSSGS